MAGDGVLLVPRDVVGRSCRRKNCTNGCIRARARGRTANIRFSRMRPFGRAVRRRRRAARPLAGRRVGAQPAVLVGLDPDRSNRGESIFMTDHYARAQSHSSLDNAMNFGAMTAFCRSHWP